MMEPGPELFNKLYSELGFFKDGEPKSPLEACPDQEECWEGATRPTGKDAEGLFSRPYCGPGYGLTRAVFVGINLNHDYGLDECGNLVGLAQKEIAAGARRVRFRGAPGAENYAGTFLYHRMGAYAAVLREHLGLCTVAHDPDGMPSGPEVVEGLNHISYTNLVKCCPWDDTRSAPTDQMWERCGQRLLRPELILLGPRFVFVFGSKTERAVQDHVLDRPIERLTQQGAIRVGIGALNERRLVVVFLPHPSMGRGLSKRLPTDLRMALSTVPPG